MNRWAILIAIWLGACAPGTQRPLLGPSSQIGQFTAADLTAAAAIAQAAQDPVGGGCWAYLGPVVAALPPSPGLATATELKLLISSPEFLAACSQVVHLVVVAP